MGSEQYLAAANFGLCTLSDQTRAGRLQIRNILCPVDFSEFSLKSFDYATSIARHFRSRLFVQHTVQLPAAYLRGWEPFAIEEMVRAEKHRTGAELRRLAAVSRLQVPEVFLQVDDGNPQDHIMDSIEKNNIDLVVMGTHGRRGFNRMVAGSVAETIAHQADCPVMVICRPERHFVSPDNLDAVHLKTVLLPTDFSINSHRAAAYALKWASEWEARVILFHAVEEGHSEMHGRVDLFPEYNVSFEKQLIAAREAIQLEIPTEAGNCGISYEVRHGRAKNQILQYAEEQNVDLIVMGTAGQGTSGATWGSTTSAVVRDGRFPVLAIPHVMESGRAPSTAA